MKTPFLFLAVLAYLNCCTCRNSTPPTEDPFTNFAFKLAQLLYLATLQSRRALPSVWQRDCQPCAEQCRIPQAATMRQAKLTAPPIGRPFVRRRHYRRMKPHGSK